MARQKKDSTASDSATQAPANGEAVVKGTRKRLTFDERLQRAMDQQAEMLADLEAEVLTADADAQAAIEYRDSVKAQRDKIKAVVDAQKASVKKEEVSA